jgi:hypothetical protein
VSDLSALAARLQGHYRPHAASPVTARRKSTDTPAPNGLAEGYGKPGTLSSRRRGGRYPNTFKPGAAYYAGNAVPATARATAPAVKPSGGRKLIDGNRALTGATSQDQFARDRERARYNLAIATGEPLTRARV